MQTFGTIFHFLSFFTLFPLFFILVTFHTFPIYCIFVNAKTFFSSPLLFFSHLLSYPLKISLIIRAPFSFVKSIILRFRMCRSFLRFFSFCSYLFVLFTNYF
ncbi:Protein CBG27735 [Caenorhabditis briggsae]|uniref:Protein CBG27735 n=1 Tax=Caenorhabditis briggsae TaxID=6238 RepID=B6IJ33_CAEBR|nr:Protein CBG27735 [Caenorhabditis briggsae]CAS00013.1 Protein CBG27735 [Caenorhabditis briggsae]